MGRFIGESQTNTTESKFSSAPIEGHTDLPDPSKIAAHSQKSKSSKTAAHSQKNKLSKITIKKNKATKSTPKTNS